MVSVMKKPAEKFDNEKKELIKEHINLVRIIASKMSMFLPNHIDTEDLIHEGLLGLMDAAKKFDNREGVNFSSYASIRIKGAILDSLRSMDWVPRRIRKISKTIEKVRQELRQDLLREPTMNEISQAMETPVSTLNKVVQDVEQSQMYSFEDLQTFTSRYYAPEDKASSVTGNDSERDFARAEIKVQLKEAIAELGDREKLILSLYYIEDLTLKEIKHVLNISEARISQIHSGILKKLKAHLTGEPAKPKKQGTGVSS
ncbi:MAG: sigma-70 family RNA polymerase sigma factor [Vulcanimicrobiota bacterium]